MTTLEIIKNKMINKIKNLSDKMLFESWNETKTNNDSSIPMVRGFLLDEIESRYPEAFEVWMLSDDVENADNPEYFINN